MIISVILLPSFVGTESGKAYSMRRSGLALTLFCALWTSAVHAAEISTELLAPNVNAIYVKGKIDLDDVQRFRDVSKNYQSAIVIFSSDGGHAFAGIDIGGIIRLRNFSTFVPPNSRCASACAIAWLGGTKRLMAPGAQVGFHAAYDVRTGQETGLGNALLGAYLNKIGLSYKVVWYVTSAPPQSMRWLTPEDAKSLGIDFDVQSGALTERQLATPRTESDQPGAPVQPLEPVVVAFAAHERGDYATAFRIFGERAAYGDDVAQFGLAFLYRNGQGTPQNYSEALKWYRRAADQGNGFAQHNLGLMYLKGQGAPQNYVEAARWFRYAADQNYVSSQYNLGLMYRQGLGVPRDFAEAARWYRLAAEQGDALAQQNLGILYDHGKGVPQNNAEAAKWYRRAAEQGNAAAQFNLAQMYNNGQGIARDHAEAAKWYRRAAEQNNAMAQNNLATLYKNGDGVAQSYREAEIWFRRAAEYGDTLAQVNLGIMYANGQGVARDYVVAHMWFNLAATKGNAKAVRNRNDVARLMNPAEIAKAQQLAQDWKPKLQTTPDEND